MLTKSDQKYPLKMRTVTISVVLEEGEFMVMVEITEGGYCGKFWFDRHGSYVRGIQIYNPP